MVFGLDLIRFSLFVPQVLEAVGRKDLRIFARVLGSARRRTIPASGSATSGVRPVAVRFPPAAPRSPAQTSSRAHSPAISIPADGGGPALLCGPRTHSKFPPCLFAPQWPMHIPWISCDRRKTLLPLGNKARLQKVIGCRDAVDSRQAHLLHQAILKTPNSLSIRPLACGLWAAIHSIPSSCNARPTACAADLPAVVREAAAARPSKNAGFIGVMGQRTSIAP